MAPRSFALRVSRSKFVCVSPERSGRWVSASGSCASCGQGASQVTTRSRPPATTQPAPSQGAPAQAATGQRRPRLRGRQLRWRQLSRRQLRGTPTQAATAQPAPTAAALIDLRPQLDQPALCLDDVVGVDTAVGEELGRLGQPGRRVTASVSTWTGLTEYRSTTQAFTPSEASASQPSWPRDVTPAL